MPYDPNWQRPVLFQLYQILEKNKTKLPCTSLYFVGALFVVLPVQFCCFHPRICVSFLLPDNIKREKLWLVSGCASHGRYQNFSTFLLWSDRILILQPLGHLTKSRSKSIKDDVFGVNPAVLTSTKWQNVSVISSKLCTRTTLQLR